MKLDWMGDGRKIPDEVMDYIRVMAVNAVRNLGMSPELIAKAYNFNRDCLYDWLRGYDQGGYAALESRKPVGAQPLITGEMDEWLKQTILTSTPDEHGYDTNLWTCAIVAGLLKSKFNVSASSGAVRLHLQALNLSFQKPAYQDIKRDEQEVERFKTQKFPMVQKLAQKIGADIAFEDEAGVGVMTRHGRTWGLKGQTPVLKVSMLRGGYNVMSAVTAKGEMKYSIKDDAINSERFIEFLDALISNRKSPLILFADHATFHHSKRVRDYVRAHRTKLRIFFLPKRSPELNPDEQVWNEVKNNHIGKQPIQNKADLKERLTVAMDYVQHNIDRVVSFFHRPSTQYASINVG